MSDAELIQDIKEARKLLHKESTKSVEDCLPIYKDTLVAAHRGELTIVPLKYPGGFVSDLQNAGYLRTGMYPTGKGKDFIEKEILIIK